MQIRALLGPAALLLALPGVSFAGFNYNSVEFDYLDTSYDARPFNVDGSGWSIAGSYQVADAFYVAASYEDHNFDLDLDGSVLTLGGGYFYSFGEDLDFVATFSYLDSKLSAGPFNADDNGLEIGGGVRARVADKVQVEAMLEYFDMDKGSSDSVIDLRGRYYFHDDLAVTAKITFGSDTDVLGIGIRYQF